MIRKCFSYRCRVPLFYLSQFFSEGMPKSSAVKVSMSAVQDDGDRGVLIQENNDPLDSITSMAEPSGPPFGIVLNGHSLVSQLRACIVCMCVHVCGGGA